MPIQIDEQPSPATAMTINTTDEPTLTMPPVPPSLAVLVVDDNELNRQLASMVLERQGHRVKVAADGVEALALHAAQSFDLILMDWQMPHMDGLDATRHIRQREAQAHGGGAGPGAVIAAMTASIEKGDRAACFAAGMDDFIPKPLHVRALEELITRYADRLHPHVRQAGAAPPIS